MLDVLKRVLAASRGGTNATRRTSAARSAHARNSDVFPLPAGAEMTVTRLVTAHSSRWRSSPRSSRLRATDRAASAGKVSSARRCAPRPLT